MEKYSDSILRHRIEAEQKRIDYAIFTVCLQHKITREQVIEKTRKAEIVEPRNILFYILHKVYRIPCQRVGAIFGKDHATVLSGAKRVSGFIEIDKEYENKISKIINGI
jgi:chromosomal replication initiator protein